MNKYDAKISYHAILSHKKAFLYTTLAILSMTAGMFQDSLVTQATENDPGTQRVGTLSVSQTSDIDKLTFDLMSDDNGEPYYRILGVKPGETLGGTLTIPAAIDGIRVGDIYLRAFKGMNLTSVNLPDTLTSIGNEAFSNNDLTSITLPKGLKAIGIDAFSNNQLASINLPDGLQTLGVRAFQNNQITGTVTIPDSVDQIQSEAFENNHIQQLIVPQNISTTDQAPITRLDMYFGSNSFANNDLQSIRVPDGERTIQDGAFSNNPRLSQISLPNSLVTISSKAFANDGLSSLDLTSATHLQYIFDGVFAHNKLTTVKLPDSVTMIGSSAFDTNQINSLKLPNNPDVQIDPGAFANNQLTTVLIPDHLKGISSAAFYNNHISVLSGLKMSQLRSETPIVVANSIHADPVTAITQSDGKFEVPISDILQYSGNAPVTFAVNNVSGATFDAQRQVFILDSKVPTLTFDFSAKLGDLDLAGDGGITSISNHVTVAIKYPSPNPTPSPTPGPTPVPTPNPNPTPPVTPTIPGKLIEPAKPAGSGISSPIVKKGAALYGINTFYLYKKVNFRKNQRIYRYVKKPRIYRPMFVVTGYERSRNGVLRYKVRDVNHRSKSDGKTGYMTANSQFVRPVYYGRKHSRITVISPQGINTYSRRDLTGKRHHYQQGKILRIKGIVTYHLTTRYILTNGNYVTANRKLVVMGRHAHIKKVQAKANLHRYSNVNFTQQTGQFKRGRMLKVYRFDYSHGDDLQRRGVLRYRVNGGYITGNSRLVKAFLS